MGWAILGAATITTVGTLIGAGGANRRAQAELDRKNLLTAELVTLENNRQPIVNPYAGITDLSSMITDLSGKLSNPFASLGVATQAAEIQIEEADIALANTLDTLRATGAGAGGATALAQAALQSKKGVAANIEQQEAANEKMKAQGQQQLEKMEFAEAQRVQAGLFGEASRMQQVDAEGRKFVYGEKERRETEQLNRKQAQITGAAQAQAAASANAAAIYGAGLTATGNIISNLGPAPNYGSKKTTYNPTQSSGFSDRRLKKNIKLIGYSLSGLRIYVFEYINKAFGEGVWQGVMSDEIPIDAVIKHEDGFDRVDYSKLDVTFKQI